MKKTLITKEAPTFGDEYMGMDDECVYIGARAGVETEIEY